MVFETAKKPLLFLVCIFLLFGTGNAQYDPSANNSQEYGYNQPGPQQGGYGTQPQQPYNPPMQQQGGGYGAPQGQPGYNQSMQSQSGGYGNGMTVASTGFASSVGGFESYRLPFERGIRTGDPTSFASHLLFVSFRIALARNKDRFNLDEKCQTETGEAEVAELLVSYYNQSGGKDLAQRILDNRKLMLTDLCSEDICSKQFSSEEFLRNAPPEVRKAIQNNPSLQFDATTPAAELKRKIMSICEAVIDADFSKQQNQMEKKIAEMTRQFTQQCARAEQEKQQQEQQQQEWQRREGTTCGIGSEPYWDESGTKHCRPSSGGQQGYPSGQPPQCEFGWNMINGYYQCNQAPAGGGGESGGGGSGQQGGGGGGSGPVCGNSVCEEGETGENCSVDCGGGRLASNVLNKIFGNKLFSITALAGMLRLQESGEQKCPDGICDDAERANPYLCPQDCGGSPASGGSGGQQQVNCPPGEYPDPARIGNCIRPGSGEGGYDMPSSGGGYGSGMGSPTAGNYGPPQGGGFGGPGFGDYSFEEMCENPEQKIREQFSSEMDGMKEQMSYRCDGEATRRTQEILMHQEDVLLNQAECIADTAEMCSDATAVVEALEKALNNIQEPANQIANFECTKRMLAAQAQATRNEMAQAALELAVLTDTSEQQLGQEGVAAGSAAAMGIINKNQAIEKSKQEAGFVRWFIESPAVKEAQKAAAEALEDNLATVEDLEKQGSLTPEQQQKLETIKEKMLDAKTKATNCQGATVLPSLFGC